MDTVFLAHDTVKITCVWVCIEGDSPGSILVDDSIALFHLVSSFHADISFR